MTTNNSPIWPAKCNPKALYEAYLEATKQPHGYVLLDLPQNTDNLLRFRTNIFPKAYPPVICAPVSDETDKVQLSRATSA